MKNSTDLNIGDLVLEKTNQFIAFNKPAELAVIKDKTGDKALLDLAQIYTKGPVYLTHRIDRPASGIVLFAKTKGALADINAQFQERKIKKTYLAVVGEKPDPAAGELIHFLKKNGRLNKSFAVAEGTAGAKKATLSYELLDSIDHYHLLKIELHSGRHHQIRAQLASINAPIKGDVKYGFRRKNADRSIHLHAWQMDFQHPISKEPIHLEAPLPNDTVWQAFNF
jgi:23S rRNA pseudouridine1911/1915/1917 synthase